MLYFAAHARVVKVLLRRARHYAARDTAQTTILIFFVRNNKTRNIN
jgi:hypothetical protein